MKALLSLLILLTLCSTLALGQRRIDVDMDITLQTGAFFQAVNGMPVNTNIYYKVVEGSAWYDPEWAKGTVVVDKRRYPNLWIKLDLLKNELHFKDSKGEEMICSSPLSRIIFGDSSVRGAQFTTFVHSSFVPGLAPIKPEGWMQAHAEGQASLYTYFKKSISESRPYGSATLEQRITTNEIHYLVHNNKYVRVKKPADIVNALVDKKAELQQWIQSNNIDGRSAADLARVVAAYNSMFPKP